MWWAKESARPIERTARYCWLDRSNSAGDRYGRQIPTTADRVRMYRRISLLLRCKFGTMPHSASWPCARLPNGRAIHQKCASFLSFLESVPAYHTDRPEGVGLLEETHTLRATMRHGITLSAAGYTQNEFRGGNVVFLERHRCCSFRRALTGATFRE